MTFSTTTMGWWRFLLAAIAAALAVLLGAGTASAATVPNLETRVRASTVVTAYVVGPHESVSGGQRWANTPPQAEIVVATGVAADSAANTSRLVTIGGPEEFEPSALEGLTTDEVRSSIPSDWVPGTSKSGGGEVFPDPAYAGRQIRIMPGYPADSRPDLITTGPYAVVSQNGATVKIPLFGNPTLP